MTMGLERVFEIASFYRAEKSHTGRHLTEFTSVDIEAAFMDYTDVMDVLEDLVVTVLRDVASGCGREMAEIGVSAQPPPEPFERITYSQAVSELREAGQEIEFGDDLLDSHLRLVGERHPGFYFLTDWPQKLKPFYIMEQERHPGFYFLTDWPQKLKPFYIMEQESNPEISRSFDLQYGYLELSSGGTRLHDPAVIRSRLQEQGLDPAGFTDHLRSFEWGMPPHSGWGLGLDRLMAVLAGVDNVREVVLYPRDPDRLSP
jgi:aspartyl-tRNA synthetase